MNTEEELKPLIYSQVLGIGQVPGKQLLMFFFAGRSLAIRVEGGALIWEVYEDTEN